MDSLEQNSALPNPLPSFFMEGVSEEPVREFLLFELDKELYAALVEDIDQVLRIPPVTAVPNAPDSIMGVFHLRGRVIVAIDLLKRLHLTRVSSLIPLYLFVAHHEKNYFAVLVDHVRNVVRIPVKEITPADPIVASRVPPQYLSGTFMYKEVNLFSKQKKRPDFMIFPVQKVEEVIKKEIPARPVLWLNIKQLLDHDDILGILRSAGNVEEG